MKLHSLQDLFVHELEDLYDTESQIIESLPGLIDAAQAPALRQVLGMHLEETKMHAERLEQIFEVLNYEIVGKECLGIEGILQEAEELLTENTPSPITDAAIIANVQRIEHYEIASYTCAITYAQALGFTEIVEILQRTMHEEEGADTKLTNLAESLIHPEAVKAAYNKV